MFRKGCAYSLIGIFYFGICWLCFSSLLTILQTIENAMYTPGPAVEISMKSWQVARSCLRGFLCSCLQSSNNISNTSHMAAEINEAMDACVLQAVKRSIRVYKPVISLFFNAPSVTHSRMLYTEDGKWERSLTMCAQQFDFANSFREWLGPDVCENGRSWKDGFVMLITGSSAHLICV